MKLWRFSRWGFWRFDSTMYHHWNLYIGFVGLCYTNAKAKYRHEGEKPWRHLDFVAIGKCPFRKNEYSWWTRRQFHFKSY